MSSEMDNAAGACAASGRIAAFAYLTAEKAPLYQAIMRLFIESRERLVFHLRPQDVVDAVRLSGPGEIPEPAEIDTALAQLCEWGNLETHPDTTHAGTVDDFFKQRHTFQITKQGEAAERAFGSFCATSGSEDDLQCTALADIRHVIQELKQLSLEIEPDAGAVHRSLLMLRARFEDWMATAQTFIKTLERRDHLQTAGARRLIDLAERFLSELVLAAASIGETVRDIEAAGFERLLQAAAKRSLGGVAAATPERVAAVSGQWRAQWESFCIWFTSQPGCPSHAEKLRERARAAIPALLSLITTFNDERIHRIDRSSDFRVLARWFAEAESDADAHRLWRAVFGFGSARHLIINDATLDDHEAQLVPANTSWLDAPPLRISTHLRDWGSNSRTGRLSRIIDRTAEKEKLAAATREEALRILHAQGRFGTGRRLRLSELEHLEPAEFDLFLDLLGEAVSARVFAAETVEILSGDGCLRIKLEPADDGQEALILTPDGIFSGPDHWISVEPISTEDAIEVLM